MDQIPSVRIMKGVFDQPASSDDEVEEKLTHACEASGITLLQQAQGSGDTTKEHTDAGP